MTDFPKAVQSKCDSCGLFFDLDKLHWMENGEALCFECLDSIEVEVHDIKPKEIKFFYPLYFLFDHANNLLHITLDLDTAKDWRNIQESWWWYNVATIAVKFFPTEKEAKEALKALTGVLCPLYIDITDPKDGEEPDLVKIDGNKPEKVVLSFRVPEPLERDLRLASIKLKVKQSDLVRSILSNGVKHLLEEI